MRKRNVRLLENPLDNNLSIQLQEFSEDINQNKKGLEKDFDISKKIKQPFELMKEEEKQTEEKNNNTNKRFNHTISFNSDNHGLAFKNNNTNDIINKNNHNDFDSSDPKKTLDENFYYNHNDKAFTANTNINSKEGQKPGFFKRATRLLKSAFILNPNKNQDQNQEQKEMNDFNFQNKQSKQMILKQIQNFQKICVQEEMEGDESNFYFKQFLEIFLLHCGFFLFGIFIVPFYKLIYGSDLIRNLGFWGKRLLSSRNAQYSYWIFFMITLAFSWRIDKANKKGNDKNIPADEFYKQEITLSISYGSILLVFLRYLIVSIKYGFFPKKYYQDIKTKVLFISNFKSNYLQYGWIEPDFSIVNIYLKSAFKSNNTNYKSFYLECVGQIKDNLVSDITKIEVEIQTGNNKKRASYARKIKKEKVSTMKVIKRSSKSLKKVSFIEEAKKSNKELAQKLEEHLKRKNDQGKNFQILQNLKLKSGNNSIVDNNNFISDGNIQNINIDYNNNDICNESKQIENKKLSLNLLNSSSNGHVGGYFEDSVANEQDFKINFFFNSFNEEKTKNGFFDDIINERNLNKNYETDDNKSKVSCESSESSVGNLSFLEGTNNNNNNNHNKKGLKDLLNNNKKTKSFMKKEKKISNFDTDEEDQQEQEQEEEKNAENGTRALGPALLKLKKFVNTTLREHIRKLKRIEQKKKLSMQGKIEFVNKNVYKINGLYLSKMIIKKINNSINFLNYKCFHIFLVFLLIIIPVVVIYKIFRLAEPKETTGFLDNYSDPFFNGTKQNTPFVNPNFNFSTFNFSFFNGSDFGKADETFWDDTSNNSNSNDGKKYTNDLRLLKFNKVSFILLAFSVFSCIIPVWVNTENLVYGLIDFERRRKIMEILYDIINPRNVNTRSKDKDYGLPILNITSQETIINWYHLRNIMMRYGKRFSDRIMIQTSVVGVFLVFSLIAMFIVFIGNFGSLSTIVKRILKNL